MSRGGGIRDKYFLIQSSLHGAAFYGGWDSPEYDNDLKTKVRKILELTGFYDDAVESE